MNGPNDGSLSGQNKSRGSDEAGFTARVAVLLSKLICGDPLTRGRAAIPLAICNEWVTTPRKVSHLEAVWSKRESASAFPQHISLLAHVLFDIPGTTRVI